MSVDMSPQAISARLKAACALADLRPAHRTDAKTDMSSAAITARLRAVDQLNRLCAQLADAGPPMK
jgi:hypothetical protein